MSFAATTRRHRLAGSHVPFARQAGEIETNADRIKAMSDEELARWLCSIIPGIVQKLRDELARVTAERDAAVKTIFEWTGCPECKQWDSENEWCMKHDREADSSDGCNTPEWRGAKEG